MDRLEKGGRGEEEWREDEGESGKGNDAEINEKGETAAGCSSVMTYTACARAISPLASSDPQTFTEQIGEAVEIVSRERSATREALA